MRAFRLATALLLAAALLGAGLPRSKAAESVQTFEVAPVGTFTVPPGGTPTPAADPGAASVVEPPRVPMAPEEYARLKRDAGTLAAIAPEAPLIPRRGVAANGATVKVERGCRTNSGVAGGPAPPNVRGAAGTSTLVVVTDSAVGIYDKATCGALALLTLDQFFVGTVLPGETLHDPNVVFDIASGRFLLVALSRKAGDPAQSLYYAVSKDSTGVAWTNFRLSLFGCKRAAENLLQSPNIGYTANTWAVTLNDFAADNSATSTLITFPKAPTLLGVAHNSRCRQVPDVNLAPSVVFDGDQVMTLLSPGSGNGEKLARWLLDTPADFVQEKLDPGAPVAIPAWTAPPPALQPNLQGLDTGDGRFVSASVQIGGSVINAHTVAYRRVTGPVLARLQIYAIGRGQPTAVTVVSPATSMEDYIFMASLGFSQNTVAIAATRTNPSITTGSEGNASSIVFFFGRTANLGDPASWAYDVMGNATAPMSTAGKDAAGNNIPCNSAPRRFACAWGASSVQPDPSEPNRVWAFGELGTGASESEWTTIGGLVSSSNPAGGTPATPAPAPEASAAPAPAPAEATKKKGTLTPEEMTDVLRAD